MDNISINDILNLVNDYSEEELNKIKKAYEYASNLHSHQFRDSNEPYIIHPLNVAYISILYYRIYSRMEERQNWKINYIIRGYHNNILAFCSKLYVFFFILF